MHELSDERGSGQSCPDDIPTVPRHLIEELLGSLMALKNFNANVVDKSILPDDTKNYLSGKRDAYAIVVEKVRRILNQTGA